MVLTEVEARYIHSYFNGRFRTENNIHYLDGCSYSIENITIIEHPENASYFTIRVELTPMKVLGMKTGEGNKDFELDKFLEIIRLKKGITI